MDQILDVSAFAPWKDNFAGSDNPQHWRIWHRYFNPAGTLILVKLVVFDTNVAQAGQYYFTFNTSGQNIVFYNRQPPGGHNTWWDNSRIFHADFNRREITNRNGTISAPHPQSGPVGHLGLSPNRALIVGDSRPGSNPVWVRLYEKANATPLETLYSSSQTSVVWDDKVHTNASFSRDGTKIYCNKPVSSSSARLMMYDISSYT